MILTARNMTCNRIGVAVGKSNKNTRIIVMRALFIVISEVGHIGKGRENWVENWVDFL